MGKKQSEATSSQKLLSLFIFLHSCKRRYTLTELTDIIDCSKQTILRLVEQLNDKMPDTIITEKIGRELSYKFNHSKSNIPLSLNANGLYQLALCYQFLSNLLPKNIRDEMKASLEQTAALLPEDINKPQEGIGSSLSKGYIDHTPFQKILNTLMDSIQKKTVCILTYRSSLHKAEKTFHYAPKRLVVFRESILIYGFRVSNVGTVSALYDDPTVLALQRIQNCNVTDRSAASLPEITEPDNEAFGLIQHDTVDVSIYFSETVSTYVAERQWCKTQRLEKHENGAITLHLKVQSIEECIAWVLSFGTKAEVLSPEWFRERMRDTISDIAKRYT